MTESTFLNAQIVFASLQVTLVIWWYWWNFRFKKIESKYELMVEAYVNLLNHLEKKNGRITVVKIPPSEKGGDDVSIELSGRLSDD